MPPADVPQISLPHQDDTAGPPAALLAAGFFMAGLGTVLLGPILPTVSARWHLTDAAAGSLLFTKFLGAFAGGATVPTRLRYGVFAAALLTAAGLTGFAFAPGLIPAAIALLITGFGLGQLIASSNLLAGHRYSAHTGSALSTFNFFWSLGAVSTGLLTASLLPRFPLRTLLCGAAALFLLVGLAGAAGWIFRTLPPAAKGVPEGRRLDRRIFLLFAALLLLYGGLETSLSSWLPTFEQRYGTHDFFTGGSALVLLWLSLTVGRMLAAAALRRWSEALVLRVSLTASVLLILALAVVHGSGSLSVVCILLGLSLAPWFPAAFALLLSRNPTSREAGLILATSGIGAAVFPWLTGVVSTHAASLRWGMIVPAALALLLLVASVSSEQLKTRS